MAITATHARTHARTQRRTRVHRSYEPTKQFVGVYMPAVHTRAQAFKASPVGQALQARLEGPPHTHPLQDMVLHHEP